MQATRQAKQTNSGTPSAHIDLYWLCSHQTKDPGPCLHQRRHFRKAIERTIIGLLLEGRPLIGANIRCFKIVLCTSNNIHHGWLSICKRMYILKYFLILDENDECVELPLAQDLLFLLPFLVICWHLFFLLPILSATLSQVYCPFSFSHPIFTGGFVEFCGRIPHRRYK